VNEILPGILVFSVAWVVGTYVIMVISHSGLGLTVDSWRAALVVAATISILASLAVAFLRLIGPGVNYPNWFGALVALVVAAVVLLVSGRFVKGVKVHGFAGAIVAAISYGVIVLLLEWLIVLLA
jgi:putative membrane protein